MVINNQNFLIIEAPARTQVSNFLVGEFSSRWTGTVYGVDSGVNAAMLRIRECDHYTLVSMLARAVVGVV